MDTTTATKTLHRIHALSRKGEQKRYSVMLDVEAGVAMCTCPAGRYTKDRKHSMSNCRHVRIALGSRLRRLANERR